MEAVHLAEPRADEYAAHALALATMMSTPYVLRGDDAGRKTSGAVPDTLAVAGKEIIRERETVELTDTELLHERDTFDGAAKEIDEYDAEQEPAVTGAESDAARQRHDVQPAVCAAAWEQQHPPRHAPEEQSKGEPQVSPGFTVRHAPFVGAQAEQPRTADELEQQ